MLFVNTINSEQKHSLILQIDIAVRCWRHVIEKKKNKPDEVRPRRLTTSTMHGIPLGFSSFELYLAVAYITAVLGIWRLTLVLISNSVFLKPQRNKILSNYKIICVLKANYCQFFVNGDNKLLLGDKKSSR